VFSGSSQRRISQARVHNGVFGQRQRAVAIFVGPRWVQRSRFDAGRPVTTLVHSVMGSARERPNAHEYFANAYQSHIAPKFFITQLIVILIVYSVVFFLYNIGSHPEQWIRRYANRFVLAESRVEEHRQDRHRVGFLRLLEDSHYEPFRFRRHFKGSSAFVEVKKRSR
jgi:hypothetical protein